MQLNYTNTNTVGLKPNLAEIKDLVTQGLVRVSYHPEDPELAIYTYTPKAQYMQEWTPQLLMCRGLIFRGEELIARPFPKFFNVQELESIPRGPWTVAEKWDGSSGILYEFAPGDYRIATKGSFDSKQARWATKWWKEHNADGYNPKGFTTIFEIIYPENRIVVDYGECRELRALATLDNSNGDTAWQDFTSLESSEDTISTLLNSERENHEGYVLTNADGYRVKIKHAEYVRLHAIISDLSTYKIWEYVRTGRPLSEMLDHVPDEYRSWILAQADVLKLKMAHEWRVIRESLEDTLAQITNPDDLKEVWQYLEQRHPRYKHKVMTLYKVEKALWDELKPELKYPAEAFGEQDA